MRKTLPGDLMITTLKAQLGSMSELTIATQCAHGDTVIALAPGWCCIDGIVESYDSATIVFHSRLQLIGWLYEHEIEHA